MEPTSNKPFPTVFIADIGLLFLIVIAALLIPLVNSGLQRGEIKDHSTVLVYLPDGFDPQKTYPLVFALSPNGDARASMKVWTQAAEKYDWMVASSKEFRNEVSMDVVMTQVANEFDFVEQNYPVDRERVIMSGLSGGGMGSYAQV